MALSTALKSAPMAHCTTRRVVRTPARGAAALAQRAQPLAAAAGGAACHRRLDGMCRRNVATAAASTEPSGFAMAEAAYDDAMSAADIKAALLDSLFGTERGLAARSEVRAEINELITQLEAHNPNPSPTEAMAALNGEWKLAYTSNSELLAILALSKLPLVEVGDITQRIDAAASTVENKVAISVPLSTTSLSATAAFEVRSPKRIAVRFERGAVATPQLATDVVVPDSISVLGQTVDLTPLRGLLQPAGSALSGALSAARGLLERAPEALTFPLPGASGNGGGRGGSTWLLTTYLDEDTRISRGDGGSVFILVKETPVTDATAVIEPPSSASASASAAAPASSAPVTPPAPDTPAGYI